jgi:hypothetical protein
MVLRIAKRAVSAHFRANRVNNIDSPYRVRGIYFLTGENNGRS